MTAGHPVQPSEQPACLVAGFTFLENRPLQASLGDGIAEPVHGRPSRSQGGQPCFGSFGGHARPRLEGGLCISRGHLAGAQPVLDVPPAGPAVGQAVETFFGPVELLLPQLGFGLEELGPKLTIPGDQHSRPRADSHTDDQDQHQQATWHHFTREPAVNDKTRTSDQPGRVLSD